MAVVAAYETKRGKRYRVRYRTPDNRQTDKRGFRTKREAERFANTVEVAKLKGEYVNPADARRTLDDLGQAWLDRQKGHLKPSGYAVMETAWRVRVKPRWGKVALGDIKPTAVQAWMAELGQGTEDTKAIGAASIKRAQYVLAQILADAVTDNLIPKNPAAGLKLPKTSRKRPVYLTHQHVDDLANAAGDYGTLVLMLAYTGMRWGEAISLRVGDLDLLRKRALIHENAVQSGTSIYVGTPKAHKQRSIPLPEFLVPPLARHCENKGRGDLLFGDGNHLRRPHPVSGWFAKAVESCREASLIQRAQEREDTSSEPATQEFPRVTPHDLRHTAASLAVSAGANVKAVQRMLGHASAAMTLDLYADLFDDDLEAVAVALDKARQDMLSVVDT
ncbi:integrase [Mycobacterium sp. 852002-51152_SCH6134967]|uniref:tyrosine-type recombinase/integrase n=1 Tax=Mycobacterium sp. 852002-51152_SCH6134967 TaxID=1834096 RepID=UPI0007FFE416|nr:tyrosine-type recombinase/integrase [Mycobacterium sp. 852002-51152_SCH6134967]OBF95109.1 integrase [Mycobacterium sp. 852002-51152_SCH6134967]